MTGTLTTKISSLVFLRVLPRRLHDLLDGDSGSWVRLADLLHVIPARSAAVLGALSKLRASLKNGESDMANFGLVLMVGALLLLAGALGGPTLRAAWIRHVDARRREKEGDLPSYDDWENSQ